MRNNLYKTYWEAQLAVQALGIYNQDEYRRNYKKDPRLPADPKQKYAKKWLRDFGWNGWFDFLGKERKTVSEVRNRKLMVFRGEGNGKR